MQIFCRYFHSCTVLAVLSSLQDLSPLTMDRIQARVLPQQAASPTMGPPRNFKRLRPSDCRTLVLGPYSGLRKSEVTVPQGPLIEKEEDIPPETPGLDFALLIPGRGGLWEGGYIQGYHVFCLGPTKGTCTIFPITNSLKVLCRFVGTEFPNIQ